MEKTNQKILFIVLSVFSASIIFSMDEVYAQSSATVQLFQTGNASDDDCSTITQVGSVVWLGCFASASTTLRINAMSGNTTLATTTLASQSTLVSKFFPVSDGIVLVDISSATSDVVRKYELSGSTITNTQSLTLTSCNSDGAGIPVVVETFLYILCTSDEIRVVNLNTLILVDTLTDTTQGGCANSQGIYLNQLNKGFIYCDSTELYTFTLSGSTITFVDSLTGWTSIASGVNIIFNGDNVWVYDNSGATIDVANVQESDMTFTSGVVTVPSQTDAVSLILLFAYLFSGDNTDDNILVYDTRDTQPAPALANFGGGGLDAIRNISTGSDGISILVAAAVTDLGRYYIISDIIIDGNSVDDTPNDPFGTGIDCDDPAHSYKLICHIPTGGIPTNVGNATGTALIFLGCQVVFQTCEDTNPQTNGMGLLAFIASLFVIIGMFYYVLGTDRVANIPLFVWITIVIALSAFFTLSGWIDPVFLILSIVVVIAMAAPKIIGKLRGGDTLGGGSTE